MSFTISGNDIGSRLMPLAADIQLVKKVSDHPLLVSYKDFIQINPL
jgi:hypothetical protein